MDNKKGGNILLVANYPSDTSYAWWLMENYWAAIGNYFNLFGITSYLIFPELRSVSDILKDSQVTLIEHDFDDSSASNCSKLSQLIKSNNISYIYLTDKPYYDIKYLWLRLLGIKRIILHDHTPGERTRPNFPVFLIKKAFFSMPLITCDMYIGVSRFIYNRLVRTTGIPARKCTYVLNGIQPIEDKAKDIMNLREEFQLPPESILVISAGRAVIYKGIDFIIECANLLVNDMHIENVYFYHCGDGPDMAEFRQLVHKYHLENRFYFLGHRTDIRRLLPSCDIAFHAAKGEAFSLSILEYLSAGLAAIVPDSCGNMEVVIDNKTGLLYEPGNIDSAIQCLREAISNPDLRVRLGNEGREAIKEKFTLKRANEELLAILGGEILL